MWSTCIWSTPAGRRVHPDRLEDRQLDRKPEPKLLPSESRAYREQGKVSRPYAGGAGHPAGTDDTRRHGTEQAQARRYWDARKETLGITETQPMAHKLYAITEARAQRRDHPPERPWWTWISDGTGH